MGWTRRTGSGNAAGSPLLTASVWPLADPVRPVGRGGVRVRGMYGLAVRGRGDGQGRGGRASGRAGGDLGATRSEAAAQDRWPVRNRMHAAAPVTDSKRWPARMSSPLTDRFDT